MTIRALIADDEPLARRRIRRFLRDQPDVDVVGECGDGESTIAAIRDAQPDLLFLDVRMPDLDGFGVLRALRHRRPPAVVFTTAFDEHAVRAFEVQALDYLVKPIARDRLHASVARARAVLGDDARPRAWDAVVATLATQRPLSTLVVKRDGRSLFVRVDDVRWIEADRNHVWIHTASDRFAYAETISRLETRLDARRFVRVHRSTIVNVGYVAELQPWFRGDAILILRDGTKLGLSRSHRPKLAALLGQPL
jgi:two-component system LytT family response regulator